MVIPKRLAKYRMFDDVTKQILDMIGSESLNSPLFKKTDDGMSYMQLIDWTPITTEEQRKCGYDPHILALDTFKKRIIEEYKNMIECSPLEAR